MKVEFLRKSSNILRTAEACARVCYNSFNRINDDSATDLLTKKIVPLRHEEVIESNMVIFKLAFTDKIDYKLLFSITNKNRYLTIIPDKDNLTFYLVCNVRSLKDLYRNNRNLMLSNVANIDDSELISFLESLKNEIYKNIPYQFFVDMEDIFDNKSFIELEKEEPIQIDLESDFMIMSSMFESKSDKDEFFKNIVNIKSSDMTKMDFYSILINNFNRSDANQLVRHRCMSFAQRSQRYIKESNFETITDFENTEDKLIFDDGIVKIKQCYSELLNRKVKAEDARTILPNSIKTNIFISGPLSGWMDVYEKRAMNSHAQKKIRNTIKDIVDNNIN